MIELQDLRFAYPQGGFALQVDNLTVAQGKRCCWVGPSGSGTTTLLHLASGIFTPQAGQVKTCAVDLTPLSDAARRDFRIANVGLVFQDFALLDYLSVLENILLPYRISRVLKLDLAVRARAKQLATSVGLGEMLSRRPAQLSQGERQRVAVCRAIIASPQLVLADEPTANLDTNNATRVLETLENYAAEHRATLVVVSHDRDVVARYDDLTNVSEFCAKTELIKAGEGDNV